MEHIIGVLTILVRNAPEVEKLCIALEQEGEPDFDGLLRGAVKFLEHGGRRVSV